MNHWTKLSIDYANQRNYLDDLYTVYPTIPQGIREIDKDVWTKVENAYKENEKIKLLNNLLKLDLFPIKNSYIAYLRKDPTAIERNPKTVDRICGQLYEMGLDRIFKECTKPKETNRQIGPLFRQWLQKGTLGANVLNLEDFKNTK